VGPIQATTAFIGPTVSLTIAAGALVYVSSTAALGAGSSAATSLNLYICHRTGTGPIATVGGGTFGLTSPANQRLHYGLSAVASATTGLGAGTYAFGLCGSSANAANWNNNEWGYTSAIVLAAGGSAALGAAAAGTTSVDQSPVNR
jgi:hypothetical protein